MDGKSLSKLYLRNGKVWEVDTWWGYWLGECRYVAS